MAEVRRKLIPIEIDFKCPLCEIGFLRTTGEVLPTNPLKYPHKCNNPTCDYQETFTGITYPYTEYEYIEELQ